MGPTSEPIDLHNHPDNTIDGTNPTTVGFCCNMNLHFLHKAFSLHSDTPNSHFHITKWAEVYSYIQRFYASFNNNKNHSSQQIIYQPLPFNSIYMSYILHTCFSIFRKHSTKENIFPVIFCHLCIICNIPFIFPYQVPLYFQTHTPCCIIQFNNSCKSFRFSINILVPEACIVMYNLLPITYHSYCIQQLTFSSINIS